VLVKFVFEKKSSSVKNKNYEKQQQGTQQHMASFTTNPDQIMSEDFS
jgi:hypothetical protein